MAADVARIALDLVGIGSDTYSQGEKEVARYVHEKLTGMGIESDIVEISEGRYNVTARLGSGEGLMLNGHMDTVPVGDPKQWRYPYSGRIANGRLYGRGSSDMKGGLAAVLGALATANLTKSRRSLLLTFVADEEAGLSGSAWLLKNRRDLFSGVRCGIIGEATGNMIQVAQKGILLFDLEVIGKAAHASSPWLGRNAILDAMKAISALEKFSALERRVSDRRLGKGTRNVGKISGGTATNVVPDQCKVGINMRLVPGETPDSLMRMVSRKLDALGIKYRITPLIKKMPYSVSESSTVVRLLKGVVKSECIVGNGYTEAEIYNQMTGMECAVFGPGIKSTIHKPNEYVGIASLEKSERLYCRLIDAWMSGARIHP